MNWREFYRKSYLKKGDFFIIGLLILLSFIPIIVFSLNQVQSENATNQAVLKVDGQVVKQFSLTDHNQHFTYTYRNKNGEKNVLEIQGNKVRMKKADCKDQICVRRGWISKSGESIVCLPHKVVIEIQSSDGSEDGNVIY